VRKIPSLFVVLLGIVGCYVDDGPGPGGGYGGGYGGGGGPGPGADLCNPVTNAGCPSDGSACDLDASGYFACFPPPNPVAICGSCDSSAGPFCGPELTCAPSGEGSACYRYCCTNADCGAGGICDTVSAAQFLGQANPADQVGFCVEGPLPANLETAEPGCAAPAAPSNGSCVGGYSGGSSTGTSQTDASATGAAEGGGSDGSNEGGGGSLPEAGVGEGGRGGRASDGG